MRIAKTLILGGLAALALTTAAAAQEFTFKLHHFLGPKAPAQTQMLEPWAKAIEEASGGRVKIEIFPSMSLGGTPPELISQVRDGVVDMVWTVNGYTAGQFPRSEVFELPFIMTNDPAAANLALYDMFDDYLAEEYKGVKVLFLHVHAGQAIHTVKDEIRKPEDFAGKKIRIPTRTGAWLIEQLGASPVSMPVPDLPQALSKGVVDGAFVPWEIIAPLHLQDQTDYQIEGADKTRFGTTVFQVSMNQAKWDSLPEDIQKIFIEKSGRDWIKQVGQIWRDADEHGIKLAEDAGNRHIVLTPEETEAFRVKLEPVLERWKEEVAAKGIDGAALIAKARELIAANAQ
jgi:TRAP-type C4-dicarboxylate transport system, periplasmic component